MKISISNIGWDKEKDEEMYKYISSIGFQGLEIAPTRIIEKNPYNHLEEAKEFAIKLYRKYNIEISSIQSIWYGRKENIFNDFNQRKELIKYTKQAIDFAKVVKCKNLVFGCPKNRIINDSKKNNKIIEEFFFEIGNYAIEKNVYFSIEPNPIIYGTNFINTTDQAIQIVKNLNNKGIKINLDLGAIIYNKENLNIVEKNIELINHIHISEPNLKVIIPRKIHKDLLKILKNNKYDGYISIEMGKQEDIKIVKETLNYVKRISEEIYNAI